jgi:threonine dehydrogenase-like Zn-dependent dehydrogenase
VCIDAVGCEAVGAPIQDFTGRAFIQGGSAIALHWAINSVKKGGIVSVVGVYGMPWNMVPMGSILNKGITLRANQASVKRLLPRLINHVMSGVLNPKGLITHRIPLEEVNEGYHIFSAKRDHIIKPVLIPPRARVAA